MKAKKQKAKKTLKPIDEETAARIAKIESSDDQVGEFFNQISSILKS